MMKRSLFLAGCFLCISVAIQAQKLQFQGGKVYQHDRLYTGSDSLFFDGANTKLKAVSIYHKGLKEGAELYFYPDGKPKAKRFWKRGKKEGEWHRWNSSGRSIAVAEYKKGKKHGCWKVWHDNGQLLYVMYYHKGKKTGHWKQWNSQGKLIMEKQY